MIKKISLLFIITGLMLFSCKKEKNEPEPQENLGKLFPTKTEVKQLEFVIMSSTDIQLTKSSYSGTIGGVVVTLGKDQNNSLCFVMPDLTAGNYSLSTKIEEQDFSISFKVQALNPILNPDLLIMNTINTFTVPATIVSSLSTVSDQFMGNGSTNANFNTLNNYHQMLIDSLNSASPSEKLELAKFMTANPDLFSPFENATEFLDSLNGKQANFNSYPEDVFNKFEADVKNLLSKNVFWVIAFSAGGTASYFIPGVGPLVSFAFFYAAAKSASEGASFVTVFLDKKVFPAFNSIIVDDFQKGSLVYHFNHNQQHSFGLSANYRNLGLQDMNSNSTGIKSIINSLNTFENIWNKINSFLPTKLVGTPPHIKNINNYTTKKWRIKPSLLSIGSINNQSVTVSSVNNGNYIKATFSNAESSSQSFNFSIVYNNTNSSINFSNPFQGVVSGSTASPTLTGVFYSNPSLHNNCPTFYLQKVYDVNFTFIGAPPLGGKLYSRTCWSGAQNPGCNTWSVFNITSNSVSFNNNVYTVSIPVRQYCWGTNSVVLTDEYYFSSSSNVNSPTMSTIVPQ